MISMFFALTILINEVMPAPTNTPEWVELYNPSAAPINIGGWYLDDDTPGGTQISIPADTVIAPASLYVVTLNSAILNNTGDAVTLYDATGQLIDRIDFGAMKSSESLSRVPDGSSLIIKAPPSLGLFNGAGLSPTPHPPTITPSPTITPDDTATIPTMTPTESLLTETPSATLTMTLQHTPSPSQSLISTDTASPTRTLSPTKTPSESRTLSPTKTPSESRTLSPTKTPSESRTLSPTKTPSESRTLSPTKTPSESRTLSPTKTPSISKTLSNTTLVSVARTSSVTRTISTTKTRSHTRTPRPSSTSRPTRTRKYTHTPSPTHTPRARTTPHLITASDNVQERTQPSPTASLIDVTGNVAQPQLIICPPHPSTLHNWMLITDGHQIVLPESRRCVLVNLPVNPPTYWRLANPHGVVIATIDVFAQYCARDISDCKPSPTVAQVMVHVDTPQPRTPSMMLTHTPQLRDVVDTAPLPMSDSPTPTPSSTIPLGMLLMLGGWIALKMLARPTPDVLYSEADEDAASNADSLSSESRKV